MITIIYINDQYIMTAVIILLTILAVGLYIVNTSLLSRKDHYNQVDFKEYWNNMRVKQDRFSTASRRR